MDLRRDTPPFVWASYDERDEAYYLISTRSRYVVGKVFPSLRVPGRWAWGVEHVQSGRTASGNEADADAAKAKALAWVTAQRAAEVRL